MGFKEYRTVKIEECGEPLVAVEGPHLVLADPHPYVLAGAPYEGKSPWFLRKSVLEALNRAAENLQRVRPGWKFLLTDALRPVAVQFYMVERQLTWLAAEEGLKPEEMSEADRTRLMDKVLTLWAIPSEDPATPPPHSTGAALDVTFMDAQGKLVLMGGEIDEMGPVSLPDYYIAQATSAARRWHAHRCLLRDLLAVQGFVRHAEEWWHFSLGDQYWAWLRGKNEKARFGRAPLDN